MLRWKGSILIDSGVSERDGEGQLHAGRSELQSVDDDDDGDDDNGTCLQLKAVLITGHLRLRTDSDAGINPMPGQAERQAIE